MNIKDMYNRAIRNPVAHQLRRRGLPFHEVPVSTATPTIMELKREGSNLQDMLKIRINSLRGIESSWITFEGLYKQLLKEDEAGSFMAVPDFVNEAGAAKTGSKLDKKKDKDLIEQTKEKIKDDQHLKKHGYLDSKKVEIHPLKVVTNGKEIKMNYFAPVSIPISYRSSWLNDKDNLLSDYEYSFYGYSEIHWPSYYDAFFKELFDEVKKANAGDAEKVENLHKAIKGVLTYIMTHINEREEIYYQYRDVYEKLMNTVKALASDINSAKQPSALVDIAFKHTYKVIKPEMIMNQVWYFNPYRFFLELVRLNNRLVNKIAAIEVLGKKIDESKPATDNPFGGYANIEDIDKIGKVRKDDIKREQKKLKKYLMKIRTKMGGSFPYISEEDIEGWSAKEKEMLNEMEIIPGLDEDGWPLEVIPPGQDYIFLGKHISEWGLSPNSAYGYVLVDLFDLALGLRNTVRKVPAKFIGDMDPLLMATSINNEFDAARDDLRDGRYHPESLTVIDYIMAERKIVPERYVISRIAKEWEAIGEKSLENDNKATAFISDVKMKTVDGREVGREARKPNDLIPAFDRRFLRYGTSDFKHLGRRYYHRPAGSIQEVFQDIVDLPDPDIKRRFMQYIGPCMTTRGLSMYIIEKIVNSVKKFQDARNELVNFAKGAYYDFGPRRMGKDGPVDPFDLGSHIQDAWATVNEAIEKARTAGDEYIKEHKE